MAVDGRAICVWLVAGGGSWHRRNIIIMSVLPKGRSFIAKAGTKAAVMSKGRSSTGNSGTKVGVLLGMTKCGSFQLLSAPHSPFSI